MQTLPQVSWSIRSTQHGGKAKHTSNSRILLVGFVLPGIQNEFVVPLSAFIVLCWIGLILCWCPGRLILWLLALTLILLKCISANNHIETWIEKWALFVSMKSQCVQHRSQVSLVLWTAEISAVLLT